jgi:anti-anti-sigma regulatory factor
MTVTCVWHSADSTGLTVALLEDQVGLRLHGEADMTNVEALREAIAALPVDAGEVHLELAELSFIDGCCTRELIALARRRARPRLILHQPPYSLTLLIRLIWPECCQIPVPSGGRTGDRATVSVQAAR